MIWGCCSSTPAPPVRFCRSNGQGSRAHRRHVTRRTANELSSRCVFGEQRISDIPTGLGHQCNHRLDRDSEFATDLFEWQSFQLTLEEGFPLAGIGRHRSAGLPDLLIAGVAERVGLVVVHYDADFDHIGKATGQRMQWVVPRGTL
jgi:hypothetical protein